MKKGFTLFILMIFSIFLLIGCGDKSITIPGENGDAKINFDNLKDGEVDISIEGENGEEISIGSDGENVVIKDGENEFISETGNNVDLPEGFPADFPIPDGVNIVSASSMTDSSMNVKVYNIMYETKQDIKSLSELYKSYAESKGFVDYYEQTAEDYYMLLPSTESAESFSVQLMMEPEIVTGYLTVNVPLK